MFAKYLYFLLVWPYFVAPNESNIYEYDAESFRTQVKEMDGNFIMFYAPWSKSCQKFMPIWEELAELINTKDSNFNIAQVDCTLHTNLCNENDVTGYPTLLYFHKNTFEPIEYKGTRDLASLTLFLSEVFTMKSEGPQSVKNTDEVKIYSGVAYLNDYNVEKFLSSGQHFVMFYTSWCKASQKLAPIWSDLAVQYSHNDYVQIGKINCMESQITCNNFDVKQYPYLMWIVSGRIMGIAHEDTLEGLKSYVDKMLLTENHDPDKFMKKKKALPVSRITEETYETFFDKDIVFINYFAPWCAHCMQLSPLWAQLGERFENESRVLVADVDCAVSRPVCELEKISGLPTLVLYKHKMIVSVEHGGKPLDSLVAMVQDQLDILAGIKKEVVTTNSSEESTPSIHGGDHSTATTKDEL
ncbi:unnamed protein product [Plutella xylostella]|uniref:(diamondback moth) hypothetical protein n=1 Tax=Plutella xylostella TaxID=51655 RepID=A0A8S4G5T9_PLUXY|nr:unnamed protein product [Plutella xylostella]